MSVLVIDASVALKWLIEEEDSALAERLLVSVATLEAPDLLKVEVANALWRRVRSGAISGSQADRGLVALDGMISIWHPVEPLVRRALTLGSFLAHPVYDMVYLALAERRAGRVVTVDRRFIEKVEASPHAPLVSTLDVWAAREGSHR